MRLYLTTRCIIFCLLVPIFIVNSQDIFDMFNDAKDQVVKKVDDVSKKVKENVQKRILNPVCFIYLNFFFY